MNNSFVSSGAGYNYYFVIVGHGDNPIFELEYSTKGGDKPTVDHRYLSQFIAHAALDLVDEYIWTTKTMNLGVVDKFNEWSVVAFVGASVRTKLLLVHDTPKLDDSSLKTFFSEMYEMYCKFSMNPLYQHHTVVRSSIFDKKARQLAKKYLP
jgi:hypothetical protein